MNDLPQLIHDLEILNRDYLVMFKWGFPQIKEDAEKEEEKYIKSGKLLMNFYNNVFIPEYSKSAEIPWDVLDKVEEYLASLSFTASRFIENKNFFGLAALLTDKGSQDGEPNSLEKFIQDLKKTYLTS